MIRAVLIALLAASAARAQEPRSSSKAYTPAPASAAKTSLLPPDTDLIDEPTAGVLDHGGFSSRTRFFNQGGVAEWLSFGVYPRLNIGGSLNIDQLLGTGTPIKVASPELQAKFRFYDGDRIIPAFAVGFDHQGWLYNRPEQRYNQRQRGLYFVGSQEIGVPGLQAHAGMNISDFNSSKVFGFFGLSQNISDKVLLMAEWDNVRTYSDSRLNMALRTYVSPNLALDFGGRGVGQGGHFTNGVSRGAERFVQIKYIGSF